MHSDSRPGVTKAIDKAPTRRQLLGRSLVLPAACLLPDSLRAFAPVQEEFLRGLSTDEGVTRADYLLEDGLRYFNHSSIGTVPRVVHEAQTGYLRQCESNPWYHVWDDGFEDGWTRTRTLVAEMFGCAEEQVALTRGTTEGFNALAHGLPLEKGHEVLFSSLNHAGASACWTLRSEEVGFTVRKFDLPLESLSEIGPDEAVELYTSQIRDETEVLVLPDVDNVIGCKLPVRRIADAARKLGVRFVLVDGAQTAGAMELSLEEMGADAYLSSPHKWIQAPKGTGIALVTKELLGVLRPMMATWGRKRWEGQARMLEDYGTRDFATILSLGDACVFSARRGLGWGREHLATLRQAIRGFVDAEKRLEWLSPQAPELQGTFCSIRVVGSGASEVAKKAFQRHRIVVRGFGGERNCVRLSPGYSETVAEVESVLKDLASL